MTFKRALLKQRTIVVFIVLLTAMLIVPLGYGLFISYGEWSGTSDRRHTHQGPTGQALISHGAVLQFYVARSARWRGVVAVHSWVTYKKAGSDTYHRYEVIGWKRSSAKDGYLVHSIDRPDHYYYGYRPQLLYQVTDNLAERGIEEIERALKSYPYRNQYRSWPGPNSNTFTAYLARNSESIRLELPVTAIGKDYMPGFSGVVSSTSNSGYFIGFGGYWGLTMAVEEGLEINILGAGYGLDLNPLAIKLPAIGRLGFSNEPIIGGY